jgi:hypothetical protein
MSRGLNREDTMSKFAAKQAAYNATINEGGEGFVPSFTAFDARSEDQALLAEEQSLLTRTVARAAYGDFSAKVAVDTIKARIAGIEARLAA